MVFTSRNCLLLNTKYGSIVATITHSWVYIYTRKQCLSPAQVVRSIRTKYFMTKFVSVNDYQTEIRIYKFLDSLAMQDSLPPKTCDLPRPPVALLLLSQNSGF